MAVIDASELPSDDVIRERGVEVSPGVYIIWTVIKVTLVVPILVDIINHYAEVAKPEKPD